jgi:bacterioferritin-associated ferredoxin
MILINIYSVAMYVCMCTAVTEREIRNAVDGGATSLADVQSALPVGICCGCCEDTARSIVDEYLRERTRSSA